MNARMQTKKLTLRDLRIRAARAGFLTVRSLAQEVGCSRTAIYHAVERPSRFPRVFAKLLEITE